MAQKIFLRLVPTLVFASAVAATGCNGKDDAGASEANAVPENLNVSVPKDGPQLAAIAEEVSIHERPAGDAPVIGILRAGARVARGEEPVSQAGCTGGWYPIHPTGFVCVGEKVTMNLSHPTLNVMKVQPKLDAPLPYPYVRAKKSTELFVWDRSKGAAVKDAGKIRARTGLAIIGSWDAMDPKGKMQKLAMMPSGRFVKVDLVEETTGSDFQGTELNQEVQLPIAYVVKRGVRAWDVSRNKATKLKELDLRTMIPLTGRFRTIDDLKYWATADGRYVRHRDMTVIRRRNTYPDFVQGEQKWLDVSVVTGSLVAYQGKRPVFASLVSVGRDRLGDPTQTDSTQRGTFTITAKHLTVNKPGPKPFAENFDVFDVPWTMVMSSGQLVHGAYWHSRFGVEHGLGGVHLSPADAKRIFRWTDPQIPPGWHGVTKLAEGAKKTLVVIRK